MCPARANLPYTAVMASKVRFLGIGYRRAGTITGLGLALIVLGCRRDPPPEPAVDVGIPECDAYFTEAEACLDATSRGHKETFLAGMNRQRKAWHRIAEDPGARPNLKAQCLEATRQMRQTCAAQGKGE